MQDPQILSTPTRRAALVPPRAGASVLVFDACEAGVVLRAVLYVEAVLAAGLMYGASTPGDWAAQVALVTGGALPATLAWLLACCAMKRVLARLAWPWQVAAGVALGALAGAGACGALVFLRLLPSAPWVASASTGALLASGLVAGLLWRARGRVPAATAARLAELQSRIRPHFLFNTLNTAIALVRDEPAQAELVLEDLADLFRHALAEGDTQSSIAQEIELARRYLEIEQLRFGDRLQVRWSLDKRANAARLPPLILQPLVENAIKHGVEPSAEGAQLRISTRVQGAMAQVRVSNTVPAGQGRAGHGIALHNVRNRLRLLHDLQGGFRAGLAGGEYHVRIQVPMPAATQPQPQQP